MSMYGGRPYAGFGQSDMASSGVQSRASALQAQQQAAQQQHQQQLGTSASGAPLLLNNLAQHLNNPPTPGASGHLQSSQSQSHGLNAPSPATSVAFAPQGVPGGAATPAQGTGKHLLLPNGNPPPAGSDEEKIYLLITELLDPDTRESALLELSKKREMYEDLALVLWGGFGESRG